MKQIYKIIIICGCVLIIFNIVNCASNIGNNNVESKLQKFGVELIKCYSERDTNGFLSLIYPKYFDADKNYNLQLMLSAFTTDSKDLQNVLSNFSSDKVRVTIVAYDKRYENEIEGYLNKKLKLLRIRTDYINTNQGIDYSIYNFVTKEKGKYYLIFRDYSDPAVVNGQQPGLPVSYALNNYSDENTNESINIEIFIKTAKTFLKQGNVSDALSYLEAAYMIDSANKEITNMLINIYDGKYTKNLYKTNKEKHKKNLK